MIGNAPATHEPVGAMYTEDLSRSRTAAQPQPQMIPRVPIPRQSPASIDAPPASPLRSRQNLRPCPRSRHKSARKSGLADRKNDRLTSSTSRRFPSEDYAF